MNRNLLVLLTILGCADYQNSEYNEYSEKSLRGSECSPGCIWSTYAVSSGVQNLTHYCDGIGCHCVETGNIYASCNINLNQNSLNRSQEEIQPEFSSQNVYNPTKGRRISDEAYWEASQRGTVGWCYNAVADAVERITGPFLWGNHAYQAASQFASSPHFYESFDSNLRTLPAGAIVVWGKGSSRSGHISVSLGDGREASDHITYQMTYHYGGAPARIFLPR